MLRRRVFRGLRDHLRALLSLAAALMPSPGALVVLAAGALLLAFGSVYVATQHTVVLLVNGVPLKHRTHARSPQAVLREMRLVLLEQDLLEAPDDKGLVRGVPIRLTVARQVVLGHDGSLSQVRTQASTVGEVIAEMGVVIRPHDELLMDGARCDYGSSLPAVGPIERAGAQALLAALRRPVRLSVRRAVSISVQDGTAMPAIFYTTARTVGQALHERGLVLYAADRLFPPPSAQVSPGLGVIIERSKPLSLDVAGAHKALRTRLKTVAEVLVAEGVVLGPKDYVLPDPRAPVSRDLRIAVVRVADEYYVEEVPISFQTRWEPSADLEIDETRVSTLGHEGARRKRVRVHYENDRERYRTEEDEWIARQPQDRVHQYGTKIVFRSLETPSGAIPYWRRLRMYATSYNAPTAGVPPNSPWYGRTRLGLLAAKGIVAVDPRVVSLGQQVYVPGYGQAIAGDTGGGIKGRRVDLCYDDNNLVTWHQWVDVYLLPPVPPASRINYRLGVPAAE